MSSQESAAKAPNEEIELVNGFDRDTALKMVDAIKENPESGMATFRVSTEWKTGTRSDAHIKGWNLGGKELPKEFVIPVDDPVELFGRNLAPNPQETLLAGMNACIMVSYVAYATIKNIHLEKLEIDCEGTLDLRGYFGLDDKVVPGYPEIRYTVRIKGKGATKEDFEEIHESVIRTSPNYWNMAEKIKMVPTLIIEE